MVQLTPPTTKLYTPNIWNVCIQLLYYGLYANVDISFPIQNLHGCNVDSFVFFYRTILSIQGRHEPSKLN